MREILLIRKRLAIINTLFLADNYEIILRKLDEFIRKYYRNQLIRGLILFAAVLFVSILVVTGMEYFGHFSPVIRTLLFWIFIVLIAAVAGFFVVVPLLKLRRIGPVISYEQAASIIGKHFHEVNDKLLNTLQLRKALDSSADNIDLLKAGIDQKIVQLRPVPFVSAIDLKKNRRFLRYALPPFLVLLILLLVSPGVITKPSERIIYHTRTFTEEMPFRIEIQNEDLRAYQQEDFLLKVKVTGETLPDEIFMESDGNSFRMNKDSRILFSHGFRKLQKTIKFRLSTGRFTTEEYELKVFPKPVIVDFSVGLSYPAYTGRQPETLDNTGDLIIPEGTRIKWSFFTRDADALELMIDSSVKRIEKSGSNAFVYESSMLRSAGYSVRALNPWVKKPDSLQYTITVIPDAHPVISVQEEQDSALTNRLFFQGVIKDDYGFSRLTMHYTLIYGGDTTLKESHTESIPLEKGVNQQNFYYSLDANRFTRNPGDELEYYFEVCDNDGIHGPKCARTGMFTLKTPTLDEIEALSDHQEQEITRELEKSLKEAQQLQKDIDELNKRLVDKKELTWQEKKQVKDLLEKQEKIRQDIEKIEKESHKKNEMDQQYNQYDPSIVEKQQQLEQLMNEVMDEEMKKMLEEMQKLLEKIDKDKVSDMLEKMKMSNKDIEKQLDRNLEIFKQLEFEKQLSETIDKLNELAEKQEKLAEETEKGEKHRDDLRMEQQMLKDEFEQAKEDIGELLKKNEELSEPQEFPELSEDQQEVTQEMQESEQQMQKGDSKKSSGAQKKASGKMKQMAQKLDNMQSGMEEEQLAEDASKLRNILENLIRVSFAQEDLMGTTRNINRNDPKYLNIIQKQKDLKDDIAMIEDSLYALARRQPMIRPYVMREAEAINQNIGIAVKNLNDRNIQGAATKQQFVMTSVNNLALMLGEALKQMENSMEMQMKSKSQGNSSCNKPGGKGKGKMSMKSMREMQEQMNHQLQEMKKSMQQGNKPSQGKPGQTGEQGMSEKLARMAAQQEAIRNEMKKYADQLNEEGDLPGGSNASQIAKEMEQTEKDLVNKRILQETIERQQKILTRMLESEKAEQQREQEERRQSTEAENQNNSNPGTDFQYNRLKNNSTDLLRTIQPDYNYFYRTKINSYFLKFE